MLKHSIDTRKGWEIQINERPETIKHLRAGVAFIPGMHYSDSDTVTRAIGMHTHITAVNTYTGRRLDVRDPIDWKITKVMDTDSGAFKHAIVSWMQ